MPDWSPVRTFGGYAGLGRIERATQPALKRKLAMSGDRANACNIHGHDHANAWSSELPIADLEIVLGRARLRLLGRL